VFDGPVGIAAGASVNFLNSFIRSVPGGEDIGQISAKKLANTDTFESELSKMQQALGKAFPGQQSNYELQVVTNSLPTLMKSPQGRAQIYKAIRGAYDQQASSYASMREHMNDPKNNGNLTTWTPPLPPAASVTPESTGGTSNATTAAFPSGPPVGTLINGKRFKGGNPRDKANWE
jgi:hypothetical protein